MSPGEPVVPEDGEIAPKRTHVIIAHDALPEPGAVSKPTLVRRGDHDACMPQPLSEDIADAVPGAAHRALRRRNLIELEQEMSSSRS